MREFILGSNQTGLVANNSGSSVVVGGESLTVFADGILDGQEGIFVGSSSTQSTFTYPSATIAAWQSFTATAIPTSPITGGSGNNGGTPTSQQSAAAVDFSWFRLEVLLAVLSLVLLNWVAV